MPSATAENGKPRRPRIKIISTSDPKPNTRLLSHQSSTPKPTNSSQFCSTYESHQPFTKMPKKKKMFNLLTLRGLGCSGNSSPALMPAAIRPAAETEAMIKQKKQNKRRSCSAPKTPANVVVPDVCCTPPGIGFAYDVDPRSRAGAERKKHRECSRAARRTANLEHVSPLDMPAVFNTTCSRTNVSDARQYRRVRHRSPRGLPEIIMFQHNLLLEGSLDGSDRFGDWRLNVDSMSYEELLELNDRIGYVGGGLREDEILSCLKKSKHSLLKSLLLFKSRNKDLKCSICQEECKGDDDLGRLDCGHYHHLHCIKQWLLQKNACPVCKTAAVAGK